MIDVFALESWERKMERVNQRWLKFTRDLGEDRSIKMLGDTLLAGATNAITLLDNLKPLLPMLGMFAGLKMVQALPNIGRGFVWFDR